MKDQTCHHSVPDDVVYKEVVIIGNGPSGMVTSFMLSGNVPYLKQPIPDDLPIDEMLRTRLSFLPPDQSLYEADLLELAEGLEGRSQNPVPLLMDSLLRPCADMGINAEPLIEWRYEDDKKVDHVVLGRTPPGGAWHTFPSDVRTLSPGAWLSLPPLPARPETERLSAAAVARYCVRYVEELGLQRNFVNGVVVTSVRPRRRSASPCSQHCPLLANYVVEGNSLRTGLPLQYWCRRVVTAAGGTGRPNTLPSLVGSTGATSTSTGARAAHSLRDTQRALQALHKRQREQGSRPPVVLVVGSGVSAADAVRLARARGFTAALVHRDPAPALQTLEPKLYPDYHLVYKMMCDGTSGEYENYIPFPEHIILKVKQEPAKREPHHKTKRSTIEDLIQPKRVQLLNIVTNEIVEITVDLISVLIGSKPDLFFLHINFSLDCIDIDQSCRKCTEKSRKIEDSQRQCFLKNHWHYIKSMLGQSIQNCKSRLTTEINGNDTKCIMPECNRYTDKCKCRDLISRIDNGSIKTEIDCRCENIPYHSSVKPKIKCQCKEENPYSSGIGFGLDPTKPVDCRANPVAIDKSNHEMLNAPKGIYALGPLTADNFIRFIPGGALAIVADIHKTRMILDV